MLRVYLNHSANHLPRRKAIASGKWSWPVRYSMLLITLLSMNNIITTAKTVYQNMIWSSLVHQPLTLDLLNMIHHLQHRESTPPADDTYEWSIVSPNNNDRDVMEEGSRCDTYHSANHTNMLTSVCRRVMTRKTQLCVVFIEYKWMEHQLSHRPSKFSGDDNIERE